MYVWRGAPPASTPGPLPCALLAQAVAAGAGCAVHYTLRALELRRIMAEVRAAGEAFSLTYSHLPGAEGDEAWRREARVNDTLVVHGGREGRPRVHVPPPSEGEGWVGPLRLALARGLGPERLLFGKPFAAFLAGPGREADETSLCHERCLGGAHRTTHTGDGGGSGPLRIRHGARSPPRRSLPSAA